MQRDAFVVAEVEGIEERVIGPVERILGSLVNDPAMSSKRQTTELPFQSGQGHAWTVLSQAYAAVVVHNITSRSEHGSLQHPQSIKAVVQVYAVALSFGTGFRCLWSYR